MNSPQSEREVEGISRREGLLMLGTLFERLRGRALAKRMVVALRRIYVKKGSYLSYTTHT